MGSNQVQLPSIKINSEFVDRATELITDITEQIDKCSPYLSSIIKKP